MTDLTHAFIIAAVNAVVVIGCIMIWAVILGGML